jgi:uncharacterized protein with HEPN domain
MSPEERDSAYLWDMLEAARNGVEMIAGRSYEAFAEDHVVKLAMERTMEIIGEAARRVSQSTRDKHPEIPWTAIIGQRNLVAHEYGRIDHLQLYRTASDDLPRLVVSLRQALQPTDPTL